MTVICLWATIFALSWPEALCKNSRMDINAHLKLDRNSPFAVFDDQLYKFQIFLPPSLSLGPQTNDFGCSSIFRKHSLESLGVQPKCKLCAPNRLRVFLGRGFTLRPFQYIVFSSPVSSHLVNMTVYPPNDPVKPSLGISGRETVSPCETIELSGFVKYGGGGQPSRFTWRYLGGGKMRILKEISRMIRSPNNHTITFPSDKLPTGIHRFELSVTNWFNRTSRAVFNVNKALAHKPRVVRIGGKVRSISRSQGVEIGGVIYAPGCSGGKTLTSVWQQKLGNEFSKHIVPLERAKKPILQIPPNVLLMGEVYAFTLQVTATFDDSSSTSVDYILKVRVDPIYAKIAGGDEIDVDVGKRMIFFDASQSYDSANPSYSLTFRWKVAQRAEGLLAGWVHESESPYFTITKGYLKVKGRYEVCVQVEGKPAGGKRRMSEDCQTMNLLDHPTRKPIPGIRIHLESGHYSKHNPREDLVLRAEYVDSSALLNTSSMKFIVSWKKVGKQWSVIRQMSPSGHTFTVPAHLLDEDQVYVFRVTSTDINHLKSAVQISTNEGPKLGSCSISPHIGVALDTLFFLQCADWIDSDLPLSYSFELILPTDSSICPEGISKSSGKLLCGLNAFSFPISWQNEVGRTKVKIPGDGEVSMRGRVFDAFGAYAEENLKVYLQDPGWSLEKLNTNFKSVLQTGNIPAAYSIILHVIKAFKTPSADSSVYYREANSPLWILSCIRDVAEMNEFMEFGFRVPLKLIEMVGERYHVDEKARNFGLSIIRRLIIRAQNTTYVRDRNAIALLSLSGINKLLRIKSFPNMSSTYLGRSQIRIKIGEDLGVVEESLTALGSILVQGIAPGQSEVQISTDTMSIAVGVTNHTTDVSLKTRTGVQMTLPSHHFSGKHIQVFLAHVRAAGNWNLSDIVIAHVHENGQRITVSGLVEPVEIKLPLSWNDRSWKGAEDSEKVSCVYWNSEDKRWSTDGVQFIRFDPDSGEAVCATNHLTSFGAYVRNEFEQSTIGVDTFDETDINRSLENYNPFLIAMVLFVLMFLVLMFFAQRYDKRMAKRAKDIDFWRHLNMVHRMRWQPRSMNSWIQRTKWGWRSVHPWLAVLFHLKSDYSGMTKRGVILFIQILNTSTVLLLMFNSREKLPFLPEYFSYELISIWIGFPLPYIILRLLRRPIPLGLNLKKKPVSGNTARKLGDRINWLMMFIFLERINLEKTKTTRKTDMSLENVHRQTETNESRAKDTFMQNTKEKKVTKVLKTKGTKLVTGLPGTDGPHVRAIFMSDNVKWTRTDFFVMIWAGLVTFGCAFISSVVAYRLEEKDQERLPILMFEVYGQDAGLRICTMALFEGMFFFPCWATFSSLFFCFSAWRTRQRKKVREEQERFSVNEPIKLEILRKHWIKIDDNMRVESFDLDILNFHPDFLSGWLVEGVEGTQVSTREEFRNMVEASFKFRSRSTILIQFRWIHTIKISDTVEKSFPCDEPGFGINEEMIVTSVPTNSEAFYLGIQVGYQIVQVQGEKVNSDFEECQRCLHNAYRTRSEFTIRFYKRSNKIRKAIQNFGVTSMFSPTSSVGGKIVDGKSSVSPKSVYTPVSPTVGGSADFNFVVNPSPTRRKSGTHDAHYNSVAGSPTLTQHKDSTNLTGCETKAQSRLISTTKPVGRRQPRGARLQSKEMRKRNNSRRRSRSSRRSSGDTNHGSRDVTPKSKMRRSSAMVSTPASTKNGRHRRMRSSGFEGFSLVRMGENTLKNSKDEQSQKKHKRRELVPHPESSSFKHPRRQREKSTKSSQNLSSNLKLSRSDNDHQEQPKDKRLSLKDVWKAQGTSPHIHVKREPSHRPKMQRILSESLAPREITGSTNLAKKIADADIQSSFTSDASGALGQSFGLNSDSLEGRRKSFSKSPRRKSYSNSSEWRRKSRNQESHSESTRGLGSLKLDSRTQRGSSPATKSLRRMGRHRRTRSANSHNLLSAFETAAHESKPSSKPEGTTQGHSLLKSLGLKSKSSRALKRRVSKTTSFDFPEFEEPNLLEEGGHSLKNFFENVGHSLESFTKSSKKNRHKPSVSKSGSNHDTLQHYNDKDQSFEDFARTGRRPSLLNGMLKSAKGVLKSFSGAKKSKHKQAISVPKSPRQDQGKNDEDTSFHKAESNGESRDHRTGTLQPLKRRRSKGKLSHSSITDSDNRSRSLSFLEDGEDYSQPEPHNHRYHRSGVRHPRHHRASNASEIKRRRSSKSPGFRKRLTSKSPKHKSGRHRNVKKLTHASMLPHDTEPSEKKEKPSEKKEKPRKRTFITSDNELPTMKMTRDLPEEETPDPPFRESLRDSILSDGMSDLREAGSSEQMNRGNRSMSSSNEIDVKRNSSANTKPTKLALNRSANINFGKMDTLGDNTKPVLPSSDSRSASPGHGHSSTPTGSNARARGHSGLSGLSKSATEKLDLGRGDTRESIEGFEICKKLRELAEEHNEDDEGNSPRRKRTSLLSMSAETAFPKENDEKTSGSIKEPNTSTKDEVENKLRVPVEVVGPRRKVRLFSKDRAESPKPPSPDADPGHVRKPTDDSESAEKVVPQKDDDKDNNSESLEKTNTDWSASLDVKMKKLIDKDKDDGVRENLSSNNNISSLTVRKPATNADNESASIDTMFLSEKAKRMLGADVATETLSSKMVRNPTGDSDERRASIDPMLLSEKAKKVLGADVATDCVGHKGEKTGDMKGKNAQESKEVKSVTEKRFSTIGAFKTLKKVKKIFKRSPKRSKEKKGSVVTNSSDLNPKFPSKEQHRSFRFRFKVETAPVDPPKKSEKKSSDIRLNVETAPVDSPKKSENEEAAKPNEEKRMRPKTKDGVRTGVQGEDHMPSPVLDDLKKVKKQADKEDAQFVELLTGCQLRKARLRRKRGASNPDPSYNLFAQLVTHEKNPVGDSAQNEVAGKETEDPDTPAKIHLYANANMSQSTCDDEGADYFAV